MNRLKELLFALLFAGFLFPTACGNSPSAVDLAPQDRTSNGGNSGDGNKGDGNKKNNDGNKVGGGKSSVAKSFVGKGAQGNFAYEQKFNGEAIVIRYLRNNINITRDEFITLLAEGNDPLKQEGKDFREIVNKSIAGLPTPKAGIPGYELKGPVINYATKDLPFYFVALQKAGLASGASTYSNYLFNCNPSPQGAHKGREFIARFWKFFAANTPTTFVKKSAAQNNLHQYGTAVFKGGIPANPQEILVSPCPVHANMASAQNKFLGHIYTFTQGVNDANLPAQNLLLHSFWYAVGKKARAMFDGNTVADGDGTVQQKLFLNTHGSGVGYLHFRLENSPPAYNYPVVVNDLKNEVASHTYFQKVYP